MDYLEQILQQNLDIEQIYKEKISVLCVFRKLSELSYLLLLRSFTLQKENSENIPLRLYKEKWTKQNGYEQFFKEIQKFRIGYISQKSEKEKTTEGLILNQSFCQKFKQIQIEGIELNNIDLLDKINNQEEFQMIQKSSYSYWQKIHEYIVGIQEQGQYANENIMNILKQNRLINPSNRHQITKNGFEFILSSTSNQIHKFIYFYTLYISDFMMIAKEQVVNLILELNFVNIRQFFKVKECQSSAILNVILNDFTKLGLVRNIGNKYIVTKLLKNFSFEKQGIDMKFKFNIIIETNFKIYVYSLNDFIGKLLENFAEIEYKFPGFIVAELKRESVMKLYRNQINSEQLIEFLSQNIDFEKLKQIKEKNDGLGNTNLFNQGNKMSLDYLQLYNRTYNYNGIPDNVCQQLHLWYQEMDIEYGQKALQDFDKLSIDDFSFDDEQ